MTIVAIAEWRRSAGQPGIRCLEDDRDIVGLAGLQNLPLLQERTWPHGSRDLAVTVAMTGAIASDRSPACWRAPPASSRSKPEATVVVDARLA